MGKIFLVLGIGFVVGFLGLLKQKGLEYNTKLQTVWLILLIFCMGVSMGKNRELIESLSLLSSKALVFAFLAVVCSIIAVYFLTKLFLQKGENPHE